VRPKIEQESGESSEESRKNRRPLSCGLLTTLCFLHCKQIKPMRR